MGLLADTSTQPEVQEDPDDMMDMPEELLETTIKGGEALFYTSIQVLDTPELEEIIMGQLMEADLSEATQLTMDQAVKVHVQQQIPLTSPMIIGATNYVAMYLAEVARGQGVEFDEGDVRGATFDYVDYHLAEVKGGRLLEIQQANEEGAVPEMEGDPMAGDPMAGDPMQGDQMAGDPMAGAAMGQMPPEAQGLTGGM
jgi:hypothetical protein